MTRPSPLLGLCSNCRNPLVGRRRGYCRRCHAEYMREHRVQVRQRIRALEQALVDLLDASSGADLMKLRDAERAARVCLMKRKVAA